MVETEMIHLYPSRKGFSPFTGNVSRTVHTAQIPTARKISGVRSFHHKPANPKRCVLSSTTCDLRGTGETKIIHRCTHLLLVECEPSLSKYVLGHDPAKCCGIPRSQFRPKFCVSYRCERSAKTGQIVLDAESKLSCRDPTIALS